MHGDSCLSGGRPFVLKIEQGRLQEKAEKDDQLARDVAKATFAHIEAKFQADMDTLEKNLPGPREAAAEAELDMKFLRDRQMTPSLAQKSCSCSCCCSWHVFF